MTLKKHPSAMRGAYFVLRSLNLFSFCEFGDSREGEAFAKSSNLEKPLFQSFMHEVREWLESLFSAARRAAVHAS